MSIESRGYKPDHDSAKESTVDRFQRGVEFMKSRLADGYVSSGEVNGAVSANIHLQEGNAMDGDIRLLEALADKADWYEQVHQSQVLLRNNVRRELGPESLERIEAISRGIDSAIKQHLIQVSGRDAKAASNVSDLWSQTSRALQGRLGSGEADDIKRVEEALRTFEAALRYT